jgi:helicase HerA-like protein
MAAHAAHSGDRRAAGQTWLAAIETTVGLGAQAGLLSHDPRRRLKRAASWSAMRCGEPQFEVQDLSSADPSGKGMVSAMELSDVLDKPKLFSTFML